MCSGLRSFFVSVSANNSPAKVACWPDYCFLQASPQELTYCFEGRGFGPGSADDIDITH